MAGKVPPPGAGSAARRHPGAAFAGACGSAGNGLAPARWVFYLLWYNV